MPTAPLTSVTVRTRFRGPARSGNGGYTAGLLAACLGEVPDRAPVTVTLRRPPPLDVEMSVRAESAGDVAGGVGLWYGDLLVATASPGAFSREPVAPVSLASAWAARSAYRGLVDHPFPECFACGPAREPADGLCLAPGLVGPGRAACGWVPDPSLATPDDPTVAAPEFGWSALDCPGGWTSDLDSRPLVLGRMTARCLALPKIGHPHIVVGELIAEEGRKTFTATSLYDDGRLVGRAEHTWIAVDPTAFNP
jgi:hypothetical protein